MKSELKNINRGLRYSTFSEAFLFSWIFLFSWGTIEAERQWQCLNRFNFIIVLINHNVILSQI